jgi:hypothetical protein
MGQEVLVRLLVAHKQRRGSQQHQTDHRQSDCGFENENASFSH